ncbi:protein disulfide reductase [Azoarcus sp. TTM-91]|uniref:substrate-binding domain-containing protein n=1 Tax=Azoarcus sp. TTM-91 TaxID=2691581 RepID=UPI00145D0524|nr:substrate-binding domain-containing protein [Azoarcus sp. TTM-91]NMG33624.1 protein disulfide reductase [Azoarcus sp. TTM-91]
MNAKLKAKLLSAVVISALSAMAGSAAAQTVVGGGATLPQELYADILPANFTYTGTGSGTGKTAFLNNNAAGFGGSGSVHFAGSDSALTSTELSSYLSAHLTGWGRIAQIPVVATSVVLPYKRSGISNLDLSDAKVCAIYSNATGGQTWGQVRGTSDATPVAVVYRSDNSGTTELFSRYLVAACPTSGFTVSNNFATVVAGAVGSIPSHWVGASGSSGVKAAMATDGRTAYLSPDSDYLGTNNAVVAKINGYLPDAASIQAALPAAPAAAQYGNPLAWAPAYSKPASSYPIFGLTYLLVAQCYQSSAIKDDIVDFLNDLNDLNREVAANAIDQHNFVKLPLGWNDAIETAFLSSSSTSIGNSSTCGTAGRP